MAITVNRDEKHHVAPEKLADFNSSFVVDRAINSFVTELIRETSH